MAKRRLKFHDLERILGSFGVSVEAGAKHMKFVQVREEGRFTYPVPYTKSEVNDCYVKGCRKRFLLTEEHGVTDDDFYSR